MKRSATTFRSSRFFCMSVCMCATGITSADEIDDYAVADGVDAYSTVYEITEVPSEKLDVLDENGTYMVPAFINQTVRRGEQDCWVVEQVPAAGTIVSCAQTVNVQLRYTCSGSDEYWTRIPIEVIDVTPPELQVDLVAALAPHVSFGGVLRYPADAVVLPMIDVFDPCGVPDTEYLLNGEPYLPGMAITGVGLHVLSVIASDESGNEAADTYIFRISQRPSHTAAVVVKDTQCVFDSNGDVESMEVTVLIAGADFDHEDILLSSVRMMVGDSQGRWINPQAINIKDAFLPGGRELQYESVVAKIEPCNYIAVFAADFSNAPLEECPSFIDVFGVGQTNGEITFEWGSRALNVADANAYQTIAGFIDVLTCVPCDPEDPDCDPGPEPPAPCETPEYEFLFPQSFDEPWVPAAFPCVPVTGTSVVNAASKTVNGRARAVTSGGNCFQVAISPHLYGFFLLIVDFVGDCCNCVVTYNASAEINARVSASGGGPGSWASAASASGYIAFDLGCGQWGVSAQVGRTNSQATGNRVVVGNAPPDQGNQTCVVEGCITSYMTVSTYSFVMGSSNAPDGSSASGRAQIWSVLDSLSASAQHTDCEECPDGDPECAPWIEPQDPPGGD